MKVEGVYAWISLQACCFEPSIESEITLLALYAKFMAGEKRKDEDSEMILGPADGGSTANAQLGSITKGLQG
jgi:anaphase-promoting complex subunit 8